MATKTPNLFPLKLLVISLGVVLIGGTICLIAAVAGKASKTMHAKAPVACVDKTISLQGHKLTNLVEQGDELHITITDDKATQLIIMDRCTGKIIQTVTINP